MNKNDKVQGEGDYDAARNYRKSTEEFVDSGKVEQQEEDRRDIDEAERAELEEAEETGKEHAKERDPTLKDGESDSR